MSQTFVTRENAIRVNDTTFTITNTPSPNTEQVFRNGVLQNPGATNDYTLSDKTITFNLVVDSDEIILVNYLLDVATPPTPVSSSILGLSSRKELIHWCMRKLGAPVIDINVDDDQVEDRIDEALMYFRDYHFDGVERCYLHYQITASTMQLQTAYTEDILRGSILTGQTSGATAIAYDKSVDGTIIRFRSENGVAFTQGETVSVENNTETAQILNSDTAITIGDVDNKYINVGQKVISVTNILPQESSTIGGNMGGMFDFQYQFALNNMFNLASTDLVTYDIYKRYISMWEFMFRGQKGIRFNRKTDRVYIDLQDWVVDQWIILEAWVALDPAQYTEVYSDEFVKQYACSLIKQQWGTNLKKFSGIQLPGGTTLNGKEIYDEATEELEKLQERLKMEFQLPPDFIVG